MCVVSEKKLRVFVDGRMDRLTMYHPISSPELRSTKHLQPITEMTVYATRRQNKLRFLVLVVCLFIYLFFGFGRSFQGWMMWKCKRGRPSFWQTFLLSALPHRTDECVSCVSVPDTSFLARFIIWFLFLADFDFSENLIKSSWLGLRFGIESVARIIMLRNRL